MAWVTRVVGKCPSCKIGSYGAVMVRSDSVVYGCTHCNCHRSYQLPRLNKVIVYLDQSLISLAYKAKHLQRGAPVWATLLDELEALVEDQLVVCPLSDYHVQESELSQAHKDGLLETARRLSKGVKLKPNVDIELSQAQLAFGRYLKGELPAFSKPDIHWNQAFQSNPHDWHDFVFVEVNLAHDDAYAADLAEGKKAAYEGLCAVQDSWRSQRPDFTSIKDNEASSAGRAIIESYLAYLRKLSESSSPVSVYYRAGGPVLLFEGIERSLNRSISEQKRLETVSKFLVSPYFASLPYVDIQAGLFAELALRSQNGRDLQPSDAYDVLIVSRLAPYCNAMFLDKFFADAASAPRTGISQGYGTRFYSAASLEEFRTFLGDIRRNAPQSHADALSLAYPKIPHS